MQSGLKIIIIKTCIKLPDYKNPLKQVFTYFFIIISCFSFSQNTHTSGMEDKIDSLRQLIHNVKTDLEKANIFNAMAFQMAFSNPDSAIYYAEKSRDLSEQYLKSNDGVDRQKFLSSKSASFHNLGVIYYYSGNYINALNYYFRAQEIRTKLVKEHPQKINFKNDLADSYNNIGIVYKQKGEYEKALEYYLKVLNIYEEINKSKNGDFSSKTGLGAAYNNLGLMYQTIGDNSKALQYHLKSLKIKEEIGDKPGIAYSYNNIGILYYNQGNFKLALEYYYISLKIRTETKDKKGMAVSYNNIGNIYSDKKDFKKALEYFMLSVKIKEELGDKKGMAGSYSNIAAIYYEFGEHQKNPDLATKYFTSALFYFKEVLKMDKANNDITGMASSCLNIGSALTRLGKLNESSEYFYRGLTLAKESGEKHIIKAAYLGLSELNDKTGNYKGAFEYHQLYSQIKDSLLNEENNKQITEMAARYENEKKEKQIILLEKDKEKQKEESKIQKLFLLLMAVLAIFAAIIAIIIFRSLRITRQQKIIIENQKQLVEEHQQEIIDSITYAKRLQEAILPPVGLIKKYLPMSFVLYKPKDIVAGDFYWMEIIDNIIFIAVADCTGHGVPGAIVSVVCSNALNRTVKEFGLRDTGKILDKVTNLVLETFEKSSSDVKDGMDISLLSYNTESKQIQWSGANIPLWYFQNGYLIEINADRQPIGKYDNRKLFTTHTIELKPQSESPKIQNPNPDSQLTDKTLDSGFGTFYLFTDGLRDQFGGPNGKKFMYKNFKDNLSAIYKLPLDEQQTILEKTFHDWKGNLEQVDDVTVIGIKI